MTEERIEQLQGAVELHKSEIERIYIKAELAITELSKLLDFYRNKTDLDDRGFRDLKEPLKTLENIFGSSGHAWVSGTLESEIQGLRDTKIELKNEIATLGEKK